MSWLRKYSRMLFGPYLGNMSPEKAMKYMHISRIVYFFSVSSFAMFVYYGVNKLEAEQAKLVEQARLAEEGKPVIIDRSETHEALRKSGRQSGVVYTYVPGTGMVREEYNRDLYLQDLEKEAYERAKEVQEKKLAEGSTLPPDAIKLV